MEPEEALVVWLIAYFVIWFVLTWFCLRGKHWSVGRQVFWYIGCLFFPIFGWIAIVLLKPNGPTCVFCGSRLNPGASVCATCGRAQTLDEAISCPSCGQGLPVARLRVGANTCPFCGAQFECDE